MLLASELLDSAQDYASIFQLWYIRANTLYFITNFLMEQLQPEAQPRVVKTNQTIPSIAGSPWENDIRELAVEMGKEAGDRLRQAQNAQDFQIGSHALWPLNEQRLVTARVLHKNGLIDDATLAKAQIPSNPSIGKGVFVSI